jgi:hypothetical protein
MTRVFLLAALMCQGCVSYDQPPHYLGPPSIQAGIYPWYYTSFFGPKEGPRRSYPPTQSPQLLQAPQAASAPAPVAIQVPPAALQPRIPEEKLDAAQQKLREIQDKLNRPEPDPMQGRQQQ